MSKIWNEYKESIIAPKWVNQFEILEKIICKNPDDPTENEYTMYVKLCYIANRISNTINGFLDMNLTNNPYYDRVGMEWKKSIVHIWITWCSRINVKSWNTYMKIAEKNKLIEEMISLVDDQWKKVEIKKWINKYYRTVQKEIWLLLDNIPNNKRFTLKTKNERHQRPNIDVLLKGYKDKSIEQKKVDQYQWNVIYNMMWDKQDTYRSIEKWEYELNEIGCRKISETFFSVLSAYDKFSFCPISNIFSHETASIRKKLMNWSVLNMREIWELFSETTTYTKPIIIDPTKKSEYNINLWHKQLFNSNLYSTWYMREKYEYQDLISNLWLSFKEKLESVVHKELSKVYGDDYWFSQIRIKWDFEMWTKAQRWKDNVSDVLWWRTVLNISKFSNKDIKKKAFIKWIKTIINTLDSLPLWSDNKIQIEEIKVVNKYHFLSSQDKKNSAFWKKIGIDLIKDDTIKKDAIQDETMITSKLQKYWLVDNNLLKHVANRLSNWSTWSNWDYEDIKIKIKYSIIDKKWKVIHESTKTWWIERQFILSDSDNEAPLSNHEMVLSSEKFLDALCKNKSSIWLDETMNIYKWWIRRHIAKMKKRNNTNYNVVEDWLSNEYVSKQFSKQNFLTISLPDWTEKEIVFSNWLSDEDELDLVLFLLGSQLEWNKMTPFYYASDLEEMWIPNDTWYMNSNSFPISIYEMYKKWLEIWLHKFRFVRQNTYPYILSNNITHKWYMWFQKDWETHFFSIPQIGNILSENPWFYSTLNSKMKWN